MDEKNFEEKGPNSTDGAVRRFPHRKGLIGLVILVVAGCLIWQFQGTLRLDSLARRETALRALQKESPILVMGTAYLIYVMVTGLMIPGATALSLFYGWYFGWVRGVVLVSASSTTGATLAFLLSRYLFRDYVQARFAARLPSIQENLKREGPYYLLTLRLIPLVPFFVINTVMGLTPIPVGTFVWVSLLGMLPATFLYVYAGASVPSLQQLAERGTSDVIRPQLVAALIALGLFPLVVRRLVRRG